MDKKEIKSSHLRTYISVKEKETLQRKLEIAQDILKHKSEYDELTDLPNRYKLKEFCSNIFQEASKKHTAISVAILDIDFFKQFNDNYTHTEGDHCLKIIADEIAKTISATDLGARYGGDEFVIVRSGRTEAELKQHMEALHQNVLALNIPHDFTKSIPFVTVSQGAVNAIPSKNDNLNSFLKIADQSLYQTKKLFGNASILSDKGHLN